MVAESNKMNAFLFLEGVKLSTLAFCDPGHTIVERQS